MFVLVPRDSWLGDAEMVEVYGNSTRIETLRDLRCVDGAYNGAAVRRTLEKVEESDKVWCVDDAALPCLICRVK